MKQLLYILYSSKYILRILLLLKQRIMAKADMPGIVDIPAIKESYKLSLIRIK